MLANTIHSLIKYAQHNNFLPAMYFNFVYIFLDSSVEFETFVQFAMKFEILLTFKNSQ